MQSQDAEHFGRLLALLTLTQLQDYRTALSHDLAERFLCLVLERRAAGEGTADAIAVDFCMRRIADIDAELERRRTEGGAC